MTASIEVARQAEAPGAMIWRAPDVLTWYFGPAPAWYIRRRNRRRLRRQMLDAPAG